VSLIKRNLWWLLISQAATWGVSILVLLIAPRKLGDNAFGELSFAMVYVSFFELVALFGTSTYIMKHIARDTETLGRYVFNTLVMKFFFTTALIALAIGLAVVLGYEEQVVVLIAIYCGGMLLNTLNSTLVGGLQGIQQMRRPALWDVVRSYVGGAIGLFVLINGGTIVQFALAFNLACAIPLVANFLFLRPTLRLHRRIDFPLWRQILVGGVPFFIWSALLVVYGTIDIPLLEAFTNNETVGWYALAYRWVSMPVFFASTVATAFFPAFSSQSVKIPREFANTANRALHLVALIATPAAIGIAVIASNFLSLLYGSEFQGAVPLMRILALHIPIVGIDIILGSVLVAADKQRQWVYIGVIAAIFNPLLNLFAIPVTVNLFDNGAIGAAIVTVLTEVIMLIGAIALRPAGVLDGATARLLLRIVAASVVMVPVVLALNGTPLAVQILAGAATYGVASIALGTVSIDEIRRMTGGVLGRRRQESGATT
jgi:O-antigen/teichoic acid export membrane protein